jgi:hypothetical protein
MTDRALQFGHDFFFFRRLFLRTVILRDVGVVARGSVGCSVVIEQFSVVIMRGLGVVGRGSIRCCVIGGFFGVVPGGCGLA